MKRLLLIILMMSSVLLSQDFVRVNAEFNGVKKEVTAYKKGTLTYIDANDFASLLKVSIFINEKTKKAELKLPKENVKFTANNPFVVVTDKLTNAQKIIQIPISVIYLKNRIFIPVEFAASIITKTLDGEIKLDNLSQPSPFVIDDTPAVAVEKSTPIKVDNVINNILIDEKANGTMLRLRANKKISSISHSLKNDIITISLKDLNVNKDKIDKAIKKGIVREIRSRNDEANAEVDIMLRKDYSSYEVIQESNGRDILVTIHSKIFDRKDAVLSTKKGKWVFDVIVLDAGHGGKDYGAIGVGNAIEKEINLSITLKLGKLIKDNLPDLKVVYTRSNDTFVELYKRGKIANENEGKLFISIHCNSAPKKNSNPNGFEVYLLRPGRTDDAINIAERENSVIKFEDNPERYQKLTDENFILVSMAHSSYLKYSEKFAEMTTKQFSQNLKLASRGVKQAGFYVLVGASMPSVLVEAGYLSNHNDAAYLRSENGQNEIAESIFNSIKSFKTYYDRFIEAE